MYQGSLATSKVQLISC